MRLLTAVEFLRRRGHPSPNGSSPDVVAAVARITAAVRRDGDAALRDLTKTLDGVSLKEFRVPTAELEKAWRRSPAPLQKALRMSQQHLEACQRALMPTEKVRVQPVPGATVATRWVPLEAVACYAPGGRASYPSTVLMMATPAAIAGVPRIIVTSPPQSDGRPAAPVMAAAHLAGVTEVYALGGAQAVAAFAYGTASVPRVPKIVGPGNAYVTEAKRQLFGTIGIDGIAGPTELAIYADDSVEPDLVAEDLAAEAEHDPDARTLLVVPNAELGRSIEQATRAIVHASPRASILRTSLLEEGLIVVAEGADAAAVINAYAPEHVELLCRDAAKLAALIRNAGTVFVGARTPAALGDYVTGANHVLPTGQAARWASPLSVFDFLRQSVTQTIDAKALAAIGPSAATIADAEGLVHHATSVRRRLV